MFSSSAAGDMVLVDVVSRFSSSLVGDFFAIAKSIPPLLPLWTGSDTGTDFWGMGYVGMTVSSG